MNQSKHVRRHLLVRPGNPEYKDTGVSITHRAPMPIVDTVSQMVGDER
jgi:hypothetical protein